EALARRPDAPLPPARMGRLRPDADSRARPHRHERRPGARVPARVRGRDPRADRADTASGRLLRRLAVPRAPPPAVGTSESARILAEHGVLPCAAPPLRAVDGDAVADAGRPAVAPVHRLPAGRVSAARRRLARIQLLG